MEFGYFSFFKKHKYMGEYQCAYFSIIFSKGLLENISRGLFLWQGQKRKALNEINRTHQTICFLLRHVSMSYDTKKKKRKERILATSKRKVYKSPLISPKSEYSWQQMKFCY